MNSMVADVRYALRLFRKSPGFAAIAIGTLALGIGANTVIFSAVEAFLLRPVPFPDADRIMFVRQIARKSGTKYAVSYPDLLDWRAGGHGLQYAAGVQIDTFNLTGGAEAERVRGSRVTAEFFSVFGVAPAAGRAFTADDDRPASTPVLVISHNLAQRRFGGFDAVGKTLNVDGRPYTIVGVMPPLMTFPMGFSEFWVPLATDVSRSVRGNNFLAVVGKLHSGTTITQAQRELDTVARQIEAAYPESNKDMGVWMVPLSEQIASGPKRSMFVLWTAVAFVLLICCANIANLMMARAVHRSREFAIRQAVGAGRWQLLRQVLIESLLLSLAGGGAGLLLARWGIDFLSSTLPGPMPMGGLSLNTRVLLFTIALSVLTGVAFGLLPALRTLRCQAADALREGGRALAGGRVRNRTASALVIGEVAVAVMLLGGAGLLLLALARMHGANMGYDPRNVLTAEISPKGDKYKDPVQTYLVVDQLLQRLQASPGVVAAAAVNFPPMTNNVSRAYAVDGKPALEGARAPLADYRVATPGYATAMRLSMLRGRFISDEDRVNGAPVIVVNQRLADREWPGTDPIGQRISLYTAPGKLGPARTVVGVVGNVRHAAPVADPNPEIYLPFAQETQSSLYLTVRTSGDPGAFAQSLQAVVKDVDADLPLSLVRPMERVISDGMAPARIVTAMLGIFSALALMLAAMGLYGVISYLVARRTQEFGVRIAMGATTRTLLYLVLRRSLALTGTGTIIGLVAAIGVSRVLASLIPGVRPDGQVFILVAVTLAAIAIVSAWVPLRRTLASGPLDALRSE
jgi:predicted permease